MLWLGSGQVGMTLMLVVMELRERLGVSREGPRLRAVGVVAYMVGMCVVLVCAVGGYVVVAQMILQDKVCFRT